MSRPAPIPLCGGPCVACGHPASRMVVYATHRTVWHTNGALTCELPNPPATKQGSKP